MPSSLPYPLNRTKPRLIIPGLAKAALFAIFLVSPLFFYGQTLTGLWVGTVSNDSATARKDQSFEIALTEYKGKVYGYSRSEFIVNDTLYYIVKRVKGNIDGDVCEVVDDEIISYNFLGKLDKGIKVTSTFRRNKNDSSWYLAGTWKTNATKKYFAVSGKLSLDEEKDLTASKIFPHLEELKLANDVAFYKERVEGLPVVKLARPEKIKTEYFTASFIKPEQTSPAVKIKELPRADSKATGIASIEKQEETRVEKKETQPPAEPAIDFSYAEVNIEKPGVDLPKTEFKNTRPEPVSLQPAIIEKSLVKNKVPPNIPVSETTPGNLPNQKNEKTAAENKPVNTIVKKEEKAPGTKDQSIALRAELEKEKRASSQKEKPVLEKPMVNKPVEQDKSTAAKNPPVVKPNQQQPVSNTTAKTALNNKNTVQSNPSPTHIISSIPETKKPTVDIVAIAATISGRKSEFSQMVSFKSDSLELSLYDNGEIDGDTVSIYLNGEVIMAKQGLKSTAIRKTIYLQPGMEDFSLVLFAENLGKYPPNTGLLVVHDGEDVYNLRFSSDYQKNAGIIFKRKK